MIKAIISIFAICVFLKSTFAIAESNKCARLFSESNNANNSQDSLNTLIEDFINGAEVNWRNMDEVNAFMFYLKLKFGNPRNNEYSSVPELAKVQEEHPNLIKEPFRNYKLSSIHKSYPLLDSIKSFVDANLRSTGRVRSNLYNIKENLGFWKKILGFKDNNSNFETAIKKLFPDLLVKYLKEEKKHSKEKSKKLYSRLMALKKVYQKQGYNTKNIDQAIVDIIHTVGYEDLSVKRLLKNNDGLQRIEGLKLVLALREEFAQQLGYDNFNDVLRRFEILMPTGLASESSFANQIQKFESEIKGQEQVSELKTRTIRNLSLTESPLRSCLGGDCATRTYLITALDPNYHYFTITDQNHHSSGHVTIVLGDAVQSSTGKLLKTAYIDRIQNILPEDILPTLEAIRQSVAEKGYTLIIPINRSEMSDYTQIYDYLSKNLATGEEFIGFNPHPNDYSFPSGKSNAYEQRPSTAIIPFKDDQIKIVRDRIRTPGPVKFTNLEQIFNEIANLKYGTTLDKIRYIELTSFFKLFHLPYDKEGEKFMMSWLHDKESSFELRKYVAEKIFLINKILTKNDLSGFNGSEWHNIISHLTQKYSREFIFDNELVKLIINNVKSNTLREHIIKKYFYNNFIKAIRDNNIEEVKYWLRHTNEDINIYSDRDNNTPLQLSVKLGHLEIAKVLEEYIYHLSQKRDGNPI